LPRASFPPVTEEIAFMTATYLETEHQELFAAGADPHGPIKVHVPSALGKLGYYVCLRVPAGLADELRGVVTHLVVGGLYPDDVTLTYGQGVQGQGRYTSKAPGLAWVALCRAMVSRGDGVLTFRGVPAGLKIADALLCTWPRFIASGQADDWLTGQADPAWASGGVPLGGIGCGKIELGRDGRLRNFSGNNNQDMPFEEPDGLDGAYFAVGVGGQYRVLATRPVENGDWLRIGTLSADSVPVPTFDPEPVPFLQATLAFPQVTLRAKDAFPGLDVELLAAGPVVPHDLELSCLPGFLVRWRVTNRTTAAVTVDCRLAWPNLVGQGGGIGLAETRTGYADGAYRYWDAPAGHTARVVQGDGFEALEYGNAPSPVSPSADGHHYIAVAGRPEKGTGSESADPDVASGPIRSQSPFPCTFHADPRRGWAGRQITVGPGQTASAVMAVVWEMPHWIDTLMQDRGMYWQNSCRDGLEIFGKLLGSAERIFREGGALYDLIRRSDLPDWLGGRLVNCCYPLVTNSVLYRDGRFSINEGPTEMAGCYGTLDQRLGSHPATQLLFPQLNERELGEFAAYQSPNGGVNHDLGGGHLESGPRDQHWPDLHCSFVIQLARHAWSTGDEAFERANWPHARAALLRHLTWAEAGGGVAQVGKELGTSYDGYHYVGTTPYMATLWIAALQIAKRWAAKMGDAELAGRINPLVERAQARMEADLWNGRYYRAYGSAGLATGGSAGLAGTGSAGGAAGAAGANNDNCHAGMLAGEYYARMLAGQDVLPAERLAACNDAWLTLLGAPRFVVPPDEVSPDGSTWTEYGWLPYVECFGVAALAVQGEPRVLPVWQRIVQAMQAGGKHPCDTRLMYQPLTGERSWGSYYMTAPASWLVYDAMLDFFFTPADGVLRLVPKFEGTFPVIHPLFWATARHDGPTITLTIEKVFPLAAGSAAPPAIRQIETTAPAVLLAGRPARRVGDLGLYTRYALPNPVALKPGATIAWEL
jgi:uncharacterized protein (DUF608 family)